MAFHANVAFGRYQRGQEIDVDDFSAAQLRELEAAGYITEPVERPRRRRGQAEESDAAVLRSADVDA